MHCYACDREVSGDDLDRPTGRYYCSECFAPTIDEQFRQARKEFNESVFSFEEEFDQEEELSLDIEDNPDDEAPF